MLDPRGIMILARLNTKNQLLTHEKYFPHP